MAIGNEVGRERLEDIAQLRKARDPGTEIYLRFQARTVTRVCAEIHKLKFGRTYRLYDPRGVEGVPRGGRARRRRLPGSLPKRRPDHRRHHPATAREFMKNNRSRTRRDDPPVGGVNEQGWSVPNSPDAKS